MTMLITVDRVKVSRELAVGETAPCNWCCCHTAVRNGAPVDAAHNGTCDHVRCRNWGLGLRRALGASRPLCCRHAGSEQSKERKPEQGSGRHGTSSELGTASRSSVALSPALTVIEFTRAANGSSTLESR